MAGCLGEPRVDRAQVFLATGLAGGQELPGDDRIDRRVGGCDLGPPSAAQSFWVR